MSSRMPLEVCRVEKSFATNITDPGAIAGVDARVTEVGRTIDEGFIAIRTLKGSR